MDGSRQKNMRRPHAGDLQDTSQKRFFVRDVSLSYAVLYQIKTEGSVDDVDFFLLSMFLSLAVKFH